MSISQFTDLRLLSTGEISEAITVTENTLFDLRFKKATRQSFKPHEIKKTKQKLAQLKTLLTSKSENSD